MDIALKSSVAAGMQLETQSVNVEWIFELLRILQSSKYLSKLDNNGKYKYISFVPGQVLGALLIWTHLYLSTL